MAESKKHIIEFGDESKKLISILEQQLTLFKSIGDAITKSYSKLPSEVITQLQQLNDAEIKAEKLKQESLKTQKLVDDANKRALKILQDKDAQERKTLKLHTDFQNAMTRQQKAQERLNKVNTDAQRPYIQLQARWQQAQKTLADLIVSQGQNAEATKRQRKEFEALDKQIKTVDAITKNYSKNVGNYASAIGGSIGKLAGAFGLVGGLTAGVNILKDAFSIMKEFDSQMTNVAKTTGTTGVELDKLKDSVISLSKEMKVVSSSTLAEYMSVAGQLGVKGSKDLLHFTEAMAKLETASNISGQEGSASIARLLTLTDNGVQNVNTFGDEIVHLGNNFAATEKEILNSATAVAQNTAVYKLGRQSTLAYATALTAVGVEAELSGSKVGKALKSIEGAILKGGKDLENYAKVAGVTGKELTDIFEVDKSKALFLFVEGLNKVAKNGGSVVDTLNKIGMSEERLQRVLSSLASEGGFKTLEKSLNVVKESAGAMSREFNVASEKLVKDTERPKIAFENLILSLDNGRGSASELVRGFSRVTASILEAITPTNRLTDSLYDEQIRVNQLITSISNLEEGNQERERLINELRKNYPDFIEKIGTEDLTNKNLLTTLKEINNEYLTRLKLQGQVETLDDSQKLVDTTTKAVGKAQLDLFKKLTEARVKYGLETEIDLNNIVDSAKEIDKELSSLGKSRLPFTERSDIRNSIQNYEALSKVQENSVKAYDKEKTLLDDLTTATGSLTEAQREQAKEKAKTTDKEEEKTKTVDFTKDASRSELAAIKRAEEEKQKAIFESKKIQLSLEIESSKNIALNTAKSNSEKIAIQIKYNEDSKKLSKLNFDEEVRQSQGSKEKLILAEIRYKAEIQKLDENSIKIANEAREEQYKNAVKLANMIEDNDVKNALKQELLIAKTEQDKINIRLRYLDKQKDILDRNQEQDLERIEKGSEEELIILEEYNQKRIELDQEANEIIAEQAKKAEENVKNYLSKFNDMGNFGFSSLNVFTTIEENGKTMFENLLSDAKDWQSKMAVIVGAVGEVFKDVMGAMQQASNARFENELAQLQQSYEVNLMFAGDSAEAKTRLEEELAEKQKEIRKKQAESDKKYAIMTSLINTAQAVVSVLAQEPGGLIKKGIAAAIVGGMGLAQTAMIAATPIPEFWTGTDNAPEGLAWTQEKGAEVITDKNNKVKTMGHNKGATLTWLESGDKVYKNRQEYFNNELNGILGSNGISNHIEVNSEFDYDRFESIANKNKQQTFVNFDEDGFNVRTASRNNRQNLKNKYARR